MTTELPEKAILFQEPILRNICQHLHLKQVLDFLKAYDETTLNFPVRYWNNSFETRYLPRINQETLQIYESIQKEGEYTVLFNAVSHRKESTVKILLQMGISPNPPNDFQIAPLMRAIQARSITMIVDLLKYGANINQEDLYKRNALFYAIHLSSPKRIEIVKILLERGIQINRTDRYFINPLMDAVKFNEIEIVSLLLQHGARVDDVNNFGETALLEAVKTGNKREIVSMLLDFGADINHRNLRGKSVLDLARHSEIITILRSRGAVQ